MAKKKTVEPKDGCSTCRYFLRNEHDEAGYCRRNPPTAMPDGEGGYVCVMVVTESDDWCGAWAPRLND